MFSFIRFQMDRFKGKRTKRRYLTNKKKKTYLWRGQEIQDVFQSPFKSPSKKKPKYSPSPYRAIGSSHQKTICSKIYTPKGKFGFPKKKNIKTGTKSKVLRPVDKTTVISSKSKSYRYLVLVKFVLFNIDYTYCDENHMVEEMCISHQ